MKNFLKVERARNNLSQTELAKRVGVTRQTIYAIENDRFTPSVLLAFRIAHILSVPVNELFLLEEKDISDL
jgi:putative transcriptional regulator